MENNSGVVLESDLGDLCPVTVDNKRRSSFFVNLEEQGMGIISIPPWAIKKILQKEKVHGPNIVYRGNGKFTLHCESKSLSFPVSELTKIQGYLKIQPKSVERRSGFRPAAKMVSR